MIRLLILSACGFLCINNCIAQNIGMLPLTGIRYHKEGIWAKSIEVRIDGSQLLSNKIPLNREIEFLLQMPTGFAADKKKISYPAAELTLTTAKGDLLLVTPNLLLKNETTGFALKDFKALSMKCILTSDLVKSNIAVIAKLRVFDLKSNNQLRLEFPINFIVKSGEVLQISKVVSVVKSPPNVMLFVSGVKARTVYLSVDTSIKVNPKMAYASLDIVGIVGTSLGGIFAGKESFWVYDADLKEIKINDILLKQVGGAMENNDVDYTLKVPYRLKTLPPKGYFVRFRWESGDKSQVIDAVVAY